MKATLAVLALLFGVGCSLADDDATTKPLVLAANADGGVTLVPVRQVRFQGNTVFTSEELTGVVGSALGAEVEGLEALRKLAAEVEGHYRAAGYPNAKVIIPEQEVKAGTVTFQVIEPKLGETRITGNQRYSEGFLQKSFSGIDHNGVLRVAALERKLLLVSDYPGLDARASLQAGKAPGTTDVVINLQEAAKLVTGSTEFNTFGSRQASRERVHQRVTVGNLSGRGDALTLGLVTAPSPSDLLYGQLQYTVPVNNNGTQVNLYGAAGNFEIGQEFAALGLKGSGNSWGLSATHPLVKTSDRSLALELGLEANNAELEFLGARSSYDRIRSLKLGATLEDRDAASRTRDVGSVYLHVGLGDRLGGMADNDPLSSRRRADGSFTKLVLDYAHVKQLDDRTYLLGQLGGQFTSAPLVAGEQFDIGGANSVRGYPQSELLGDNALRLSLEMRHTPRWASAPEWLEDLQLVSFVDYGRISNKNPVPGQPKSDSLTGVGIGFRARLVHELLLRADLGYALSDEPSSGGRFQPYFQVAHQY